MNAFYVVVFASGTQVDLPPQSDDEAARLEFRALAKGRWATLLKITDDDETIIDRVEP